MTMMKTCQDTVADCDEQINAILIDEEFGKKVALLRALEIKRRDMLNKQKVLLERLIEESESRVSASSGINHRCR